jgi:hypothetical protein
VVGTSARPYYCPNIHPDTAGVIWRFRLQLSVARAYLCIDRNYTPHTLHLRFHGGDWQPMTLKMSHADISGRLLRMLHV